MNDNETVYDTAERFALEFPTGYRTCDDKKGFSIGEFHYGQYFVDADSAAVGAQYIVDIIEKLTGQHIEVHVIRSACVRIARIEPWVSIAAITPNRKVPQ